MLWYQYFPKVLYKQWNCCLTCPHESGDGFICGIGNRGKTEILSFNPNVLRHREHMKPNVGFICLNMKLFSRTFFTRSAHIAFPSRTKDLMLTGAHTSSQSLGMAL